MERTYSISKNHCSRIQYFVLVISLFIFSLENHGNGRLLVLLPFLLYLCLHLLYIKCSLTVFKSYLKLVFLVTILTVASYFRLFEYKENMNNYPNSMFYLTTLFKLSIVYLIVNILYEKQDLLVSVVNKVLIIHVSLFYLQFLSIYGLGYYIDMLQPFTGEVSRYTWNVSIPILGDTYRPTGFFNEPSTYLGILFPLLALKYAMTNKLNLVDKLVISSFFIGLSFASIAIASSFLVIINFKDKKTLRYSPLIFMVFIFIFPFVLDMFLERVSGNYDAVGIRTNLINLIFDQNIVEILFGNGPVGVPTQLEYLYNSELSWTLEGFSSMNANGLIFFILIKFGLIGVVSIISFFIFKLKDKISLLVMLLILLTKIKLTSIVFILIFFYIVLISRKKWTHL